MKRILWVSATVVTIFALSLSAIAQGPGGGQGQRGQGQGAGGAQGQGQRAAAQGQGQGQGFGAQGPAQMQMGGGQTTPQQLLRNAEVIRILALTEAQTTALAPVLRPAAPAGAPGAPGNVGRQQGGPNATATPPTAAELAQRATEQRQRTTELWTGINGVLNATQQAKFKEIYFQVNVPVVNPNAPANTPAPVMSLDAFLLGVVNPTADQVTKINAIVDARNAAAATATRPAQGAGQEEMTAFRNAATARNTKANDDIKALLTDDQKKKIDELTAGAAEVRRTVIPTPAPGATQRGGAAGGGAGGGFVPGQGAWQPGQQAPAGAGGGGRQGGAGGFPRAGGGN